MKERKVLFNKGGNGGVTARVSLPIEYLRALGIEADNGKVTVELEDDKIVIRKVNE